MNIAKELAAMAKLSPAQLRVRYAQLFGHLSRSGNKSWLIKRIAWRLQVRAEGDLSERACRRAAELADEADLRLSPPKIAPAPPDQAGTLVASTDRRVPLPGSIITRIYKGATLQVRVLPKGFEYEGEVYKSLSAVAKVITGAHCNGFLFFRLSQEVQR